ncbi:MAG: Lipase/esterase [Myxococcaceae bacterium]|jgi:acetyl esterase|nr:Lipase/esterase [Myxococcaceae bacterium]
MREGRRFARLVNAGADARRFLGAAAVDGFFNGFSRMARLHPQAKPARHAVEHLRDIRYFDGTMREHLLDVYRPASPTPHQRYKGPPWPMVFYVHGGGFRILSKDTHWIMGLGFARRGFVVFNVSYRLAPKHRFPCAIEDVCRAFSWVMKNAERFGGDKARVVLAGESAGANLAASLALTLAYERDEPFAREAYATGVIPKAVVPACGVLQVSDMGRLRRRKPGMSAFIADRLAEVESAYLGSDAPTCSRDLADPLLVIERGEKPSRPLPPFFLPVGTRDPLLPDTRRMATALRALGVEAIDAYYPGELHAFHALVMRENARKCWRDTFEFLDKHVPETNGVPLGQPLSQ